MKMSEKGKSFDEIREILLLCHYGGHVCSNLQSFKVLTVTSTLVDIVSALLFLDHGTRRGRGVSVASLPLFTPRKDKVPTLKEVG